MPGAGRATRGRASGRGRSSLTRRGWVFLLGAVFLAVVAYGGGLPELFYASSFLALLPLGALLLVSLRRRQLVVERMFSPPVASAGDPVAVQIVVRNLSTAPTGPATWADRIPWPPGTAGPGELPQLAAGLPNYPTAAATAVLRYTVRPPTRGIFPIGPLEIEYTDPFVLASGGVSLGGTQTVAVVPAVVPLGTSGPSMIAGDGTAQLVQRRSSGSDDDLITREYRSGDALRRVHWKASARHGELMVRQEEQHTFPEARLVIDTRQDGYGDAWADLGGDESGGGGFEWAVRMVASLGVHLHDAGFQVHVLETATEQITALGPTNQGHGHELPFLLSLAAIQRSAEPTHDAHPEAYPEGASGPVFAVLAEPSADTLRWIAAQRRQYEVGIVFVVGRRSSRAFDELTESGWVCVPVRETDDPALAWSSIARFTVQSRAGIR